MTASHAEGGTLRITEPGGAVLRCGEARVYDDLIVAVERRALALDACGPLGDCSAEVRRRFDFAWESLPDLREVVPRFERANVRVSPSCTWQLVVRSSATPSTVLFFARDGAITGGDAAPLDVRIVSKRRVLRVEQTDVPMGKTVEMVDKQRVRWRIHNVRVRPRDDVAYWIQRLTTP